ncbi:MAG: ABC transporter permease [Firmicutes bacterium]|jgi:putative ABC transport system permease protein|nr:ABC transporter permease [Bacillota bacterium]
MFLTKLALRNLARHRNRTLITSMIIAIAIFAYILMDSLIGGMTDMSYATLIDYEVGHLQVVNSQYWEEQEKLPLKDLLPMKAAAQVALANTIGYKGGSPELEFVARLNNGINELPVIGKGIVPSDFSRVISFDGYFVEGEMFALGEHRAVMGKRLADLLGLEKGDYITLLVKDKNETFNTIEAEIAGLVHTINPNVNNNIVYLPLDLAQQALDVGDEISRIVIRLEDKDLAGRVGPELERGLKKLDGSISVYPWYELEAVSVADAKNAGIKLMLAIILLIAAIAIINNVILAALERMHEIGMMKAMGLEMKEIIYVFVIESTGIGILGGALGMLLGAIGVGLFANIGVDFTSMMSVDMADWGIPVLGRIYGSWNFGTFVQGFLFATIVSLLASIWPALWAARKDPIVALNQL